MKKIRNLKSTFHSKHLIMYHLIFSAKYRRKIFLNREFGEDLKNKCYEIANNYDFEIDTIDLDFSKPDHLHILVRTEPKIAPYQIVAILKQQLFYWAWQNYELWLKGFFWNKKYLFTRGYFCSSIGNVSAEKVAKYLEKQGEY